MVKQYPLVNNANQFTQLLQNWSGGDESALDQLVPIVSGELRKLAASFMNRERACDTLQEVAASLCVHVNTVARELRLARAWLKTNHAV